MSHRIVMAILSLCLSTFLATSDPKLASASTKGGCHAREISRTLHELEKSAPSGVRGEKAGDLAVHLLRTGNACVTAGDIKSLIRLLNDQDDAMRYWSAVMLGNIGPRARSAIPVLKADLAERPCEGLGINSAQAVRYALRQFGEHPLEATC